jgi:uncharacterized protein YbjT (DUF2867 family)
MILVTGATGTIGSATVTALKKSGASFKVAVRDAARAKARFPGVEAVSFDWDDFSSYPKAFAGVKRLFLLLPVSDRQLGYTLGVVAAARRASVEHIVKVSVMGSDSDPGIALGRLHQAGDRELKLSGISSTFLAPNFYMQNFIHYYGVNPAQGGDVYLPHGSATTSWVHAGDVGEVAAKVLTSDVPAHQGKTYQLTGPEALSTAAALKVLSESLRQSYRYVEVPDEAAEKAMVEMGAPLWLVDGFMGLNMVIKQGWAGAVADGVPQVLGRPATSLRAWAKELATSVR